MPDPVLSSAPSWATDLLCDPVSHERLLWSAAEAEAPRAKYEIRNGIPIFAEYSASYQNAVGRWPSVDDKNGSVRALQGRPTVFDRFAAELRGRTILDICAGGAVVGAYLAARYACRVIAVERSYAVLKDYGDEFMSFYGVSSEQVFRVCADAQQLPVVNNGVLAVVGSSWVHHFEDKKGVLREALRVLRPGGVLIAHNEGLPGLLSRGTSSEDRYVRPAEYEKAMRGSGFEDVTVRGWSRAYAVARWLRGSVDLTGRKPS